MKAIIEVTELNGCPIDCEVLKTENLVMIESFLEIGMQNICNCYYDRPVVNVHITITGKYIDGNECHLMVNPGLSQVYAMDQPDTGWYKSLEDFEKKYLDEFFWQARTEK